MTINKPYLLFLGDARDALAAKTAIGVHYWRPDDCIGQLRLEGCNAKLDLPELSISDAVERSAQTLIIGVANRGGIIPDAWQEILVEAIENGMDIASGLHMQLNELDRVQEAATKHRRQLYDVRHPKGPFPVGSGEPRPGRRLLTVGTDCSIGKMYTSLAIERELRARNIPVDFRATGQTGILIDGRGVSVDGVISDFISGAIEQLCPGNDANHWDIVEGQGSLFHPSFAGVSLGLLHGAQPDLLVLCHEPTRTNMRGLPKQPLPTVSDCMAANLDAARLVSPNVRFIGMSINTSSLSENDAKFFLQQTEEDLQLPCVDPVRTGVGAIVDKMLDADG
ncbi:MAG: DUF1611 domain-containing protein [Gammaproteobacteria bacterium]|nr:DUF1611 domain-containing protein [Gammaproteobacteria bacterium]